MQPREWSYLSENKNAYDTYTIGTKNDGAQLEGGSGIYHPTELLRQNVEVNSV